MFWPSKRIFLLKLLQMHLSFKRLVARHDEKKGKNQSIHFSDVLMNNAEMKST